MLKILKMLGPAALISYLPMICIEIGTYLKGKDTNETGSDDQAGNLFLAAAPAITAYEQGNGPALRKTLVAIREGLDKFINTLPSA